MATQYEREELRTYIERFYQFAWSSAPENLVINERVAEVFVTMLDEAQKCTATSHYIPKPSGGPSSLLSLALGHATRCMNPSVTKAFADTVHHRPSGTGLKN